MHSKQGWKEVTPEGEHREVRVTRKGQHWSFQSRLKGEKEWTYHKKPIKRDAEALLDMMQKKYRRRRCSFRDLQVVEDLFKSLD